MTDPKLTDLLNESTWLEWRAHAEAVPAVRLTEMVTTEQTRAEFVEGARLLRLDHKVRAGDGGTGPSPEQLLIADMLNAGKFINAVCDPRRSTKTTSVQAVALGRCHYRDDYQVGWTMCTTGAKASERFRKDIVAPILRLYPNPKTAPFVLNVGKGTEHIAWRDNGSFFNIYSPNGDGFRSGGFDMAVADEGGEADVELSTDITVAVLPTMDTKPGAQFIVPGTAAKFRDGNLLWDNLNDPEAGVVWRGIPETTDPEELEAWEPDEEHPRARVRELIELSHPGVGWTTPIESVGRNFGKFGRAQFLAEYGGMFGTEGVASGMIPAAHRERAALDVTMPPAPPAFALAISIHPDGLWASVGVAWRYVEQEDLASTAWKLDGAPEAQPTRTAIGLLHWQPGVAGFATKVLLLARKHRVPIIYDQLSQAVGVEVETLSRATPRPTLTPATTTDVRRAATKMVKGFESGTLVYFRKDEHLDTALEIAVKRQIGAAGGFGFGRRKDHPEDDITPTEACALALHFLDSAAKPIDPLDVVKF